MAVKTTLILKSFDQNDNPLETTISNVNPEITAANADIAMRALNGLTTNTYNDTIRRDEQSINEALED